MHKLFGTSSQRLRQFLTYRPNPFAACSGPCDTHTALNLAKAPSFLYAQTFNVAMAQFDALTVERANYAIPREKIDELIDRYDHLRPSWENFSGNYVYVGPWERELAPSQFSGNPALEELYNINGIEVYRVR